MPKQKKEKGIEARGRNGWFDPAGVSFSRYADKLAVGVVSSRSGKNDPIYFTGPVGDIAKLFRRISDEASRLAACESGFTEIPVEPHGTMEA